MSNDVLITNIQRFSLHDGPGIRTTVFFKGCSLHCPWCSNPENIKPYKEFYEKNLIKGEYGKIYSNQELYNILIKDKLYYTTKEKSIVKDKSNIIDQCKLIYAELPGGITFSGGEALLHLNKVEMVLKKLKEENIHLAVETSLAVSRKDVLFSFNYIDLFYVDIKIFDKNKFKTLLGGNFDLYLNNLKELFDAKKNVIFRIPIIKGYTDDEKNVMNILHLLYKYKPLKVELIKGHNLGSSKYESLKRKIPVIKDISDEFLEMYRKNIEKIGLWVEICKI